MLSHNIHIFISNCVTLVCILLILMTTGIDMILTHFFYSFFFKTRQIGAKRLKM
jgi:hypothetical protein